MSLTDNVSTFTVSENIKVSVSLFKSSSNSSSVGGTVSLVNSSTWTGDKIGMTGLKFISSTRV